MRVSRIAERMAALGLPVADVQTNGEQVEVSYLRELTPEERAAAAAAIAAEPVSAAADAAYAAARNPERKGLRDAAAQAIADNQVYLAVASPTSAQNTAQLRHLTRICNRLIARVIQIEG